METFIKILFWAIVIYYALKLATRFLLPVILKRLAKKVFANMQPPQYDQYTQKKEGEVTIEYKEPKKNSENKDRGEYVDFEEIKD